jgi:hypothetical protein
MKEKVKVLKAAMAIIFADLAQRLQEKGVSYKYDSKPKEDDRGQKYWSYSVTIKELGYPDRILQEWKFMYPDNIDRYNMEYNVLMSVMSSLTETALFTWNEVGKQLNTDIKLQHAAKESLKND